MWWGIVKRQRGGDIENSRANKYWQLHGWSHFVAYIPVLVDNRRYDVVQSLSSTSGRFWFGRSISGKLREVRTKDMSYHLVRSVSVSVV